MLRSSGAGGRRVRVAVALCGLAMLASGSCKPKADEPLGPPDSYQLYAPVPPGPEHAPAVPLVSRMATGDAVAEPLDRLFVDGFAAEMLRTLYLEKHLLRELDQAGRRFPEPARVAASDTTVFVVGAEGVLEGRGLAITGGWFGGPVVRPNAIWIGLPPRPAEDRALVQTVVGRIAGVVARLIASGGALDPGASRREPLVEGYRMAMEVIAREWRSGRGPSGAVAPTAGTFEQRELFARVRENRFVVAQDGKTIRPAAELLADPGVAATVLYRLAQAKGIAQRVGAAATYAPFADTRLPPGVSPAAALGPFRNFQVKLLTAWSHAVLSGKPPRNVVELLEAYTAEQPAEREEVHRIFVVTTFGGTVRPGGVTVDANAPQQALTELERMAKDTAAGRLRLDGAVTTAEPGETGRAPAP